MPLLLAAELPVWIADPCPSGSWAQAGASLDLRGDTEVAETLSLRAGCVRPSGLRWGAELGVSPLRTLDALGEDRGYRALVGALGVSWWAGGPWSPGLGTSLGLSRRQFLGPWSAVGTAWVPSLGVEAGLAVPLGGRLTVVPSIQGLADLRRVELRVDGVPREVLSPFELRLGLSLMWPLPEESP